MMRDPVLHHRYMKYRASPKRIPFRNAMELKRANQYEFAVKMAFGSVLAWPIGVFIGRWSKKNAGGVPVVPYSRYVPDWPNVNPTAKSSRNFRLFSLATCLLGGFLFAKATTNPERTTNVWYNRPDLKPFPAMVKQESDVTEDSAKKQLYYSYRLKKRAEERKKSTLYRFLFPLDADFEVRENPYAKNHHHDVFSPANGFYSTYTNSFRDH
mmetsp:Transcript_17467/g.12471  ORF Transcript_17467/g.12471 Transcript_17467/m.12471 type:complete len:211 (-) Transcript_17467:72-704(-)